MSEFSDILGSWGLGRQHVSLEGNSSSHTAPPPTPLRILLECHQNRLFRGLEEMAGRSVRSREGRGAHKRVQRLSPSQELDALCFSHSWIGPGPRAQSPPRGQRAPSLRERGWCGSCPEGLGRQTRRSLCPQRGAGGPPRCTLMDGPAFQEEDQCDDRFQP